MILCEHKEGYVAVYEDGIFVGNYDTIEEYKKEKRKREEEAE